ncbi:MAG: hypothetical protein E7582_01490 [Ruminococcaceae bacterium]|nr:hypothetical protein [Oscillospiraceae bacterium]
MTRVERDYKLFTTITNSPELSALTSKQNILFTILKRSERDEEYRRELENFIVPDGSGMNLIVAIETFFRNFSNVHGVDITLGLSELNNLDHPDGLYFNIETFKKEGENLVPVPPISFRAGEIAYFKATVLNAATDTPEKVPFITYSVFSEDGGELQGEVENTSSLEFSITCTRPGAVKAVLVACDENKEQIMGSDKSISGALFDFEKISTSVDTPEDFEEFWKEQCEKQKKVSPIDTTSDGYVGSIIYDGNIPETNYYHIKKIEKSDLEKLRLKKITRSPDEELDKFELFDYSLKSLGPCPATGYVSYPKGKESHTLPIRVYFDGYGAAAPTPFFNDDAIAVHATHHGYPCDLGYEEFYQKLNGTGILGRYSRGTDHPNGKFDDKGDCYSLYIILRNFQMLRFFTNSDLLKDFPEIVRLWNGDVTIIGGSLGGFQSLTLSSVLNFLDEEIKSAKCEVTVPALCDYAGQKLGRIRNRFGIRWAENCEYFDAAHHSKFIRIPTLIGRCALGDEICVASGICAAYNNMSCEKEIRFLQNSSHGYLPKNKDDLWTIVKN